MNSLKQLPILLLMNKVYINKKYYYNALDIIKNAKIYCKGIRNGREMMKTFKIEHPDYIYARCKDDIWSESNGKSIKLDKIMIRRQYILDNDELNNEINSEKEVLPPLPDLIVLEDKEKVCDDDGNVLEIETRGVRECDKIFFNLKDIIQRFDIKKLQDTILRKDSKYEKKHYTQFEQIIPGNNKEKNYYLTYEGILKVLFSSRSGNVSKFIKWATKTLFTIQLGTVNEKKKLAADILGVPIKEFNQSLKANTGSIASIYFITLGTGKSLRKSMNLDSSILDDDVISIYGYTKDLQRRLKEHQIHYKYIKGSNLMLKYYSYIDKTYLSKAEKDIKDHFISTESHLEYGSEKEMVCTDKNTLKYLQSYYNTVGKSYEGDKTEIIAQITAMDLKHKYEIDMLNNKIELMAETHSKEVALMTVENLKLKLQLVS